MRDMVRILIGPTAWLAAFSAVYGLHGIACSFGWADAGLWGFTLMRVALAAAWLACTMVLVLILVGLYLPRFASRSSFVQKVSRVTGWVGLVATLWSLLPVVATSTCG
ncbi:hypothetical protein [Palleronia sp.]|uniref:hypothetical protein n=1 Tax=Palleronia sp. TaxID=1940284 RepID=UPI0035C8343E